jgi:hypothetical protein
MAAETEGNEGNEGLLGMAESSLFSSLSFVVNWAGRVMGWKSEGGGQRAEESDPIIRKAILEVRFGE